MLPESCRKQAAASMPFRSAVWRIVNSRKMSESSADPQKISCYQPRVVGFVDILGFADLVRRADKESRLRNEVIIALKRVREVAAPSESETDLRTQNFSDSIILSARNTPDGLWHLLLSIDALAWSLLQLGILIRGGVTIGGMHHDDEIVFGVGVNEAYRLESTVAKFPRVVLSKAAFVAADEYAKEHENWQSYRDSRLRRDLDGVHYLNYLTEIGCFNRQPIPHPSASDHPLWAVGNSIRSIIQDKVDNTLDQPDVYSKIEWLARYWNSEVCPLYDEAHGYMIQPIVLAGSALPSMVLPFRTY